MRNIINVSAKSKQQHERMYLKTTYEPMLYGLVCHRHQLLLQSHRGGNASHVTVYLDAATQATPAAALQN
eukprot:m.26734 g.26734  ORF g.26734 m.26734 type:complete len:70 (-) comp8860_c0_seq1:191-400(-)